MEANTVLFFFTNTVFMCFPVFYYYFHFYGKISYFATCLEPASFLHTKLDS